MVTEAIRWRVPAGSQGLMGWALTSSGAPVIPQAPLSFLVRPGDSGTWMMEKLHNTGDWHVTGYNTGQFPHTVYLEFAVSPIRGQLTRDDTILAIGGLAMANLVPTRRG